MNPARAAAALLPAALLLAGLLQPGAVRAWSFTDRADGISCRLFDVGGGIPWPERGPTWTDARGRVGGDEPFAVLRRPAGDAQHVLRADVSVLVKRWLQGAQANHGLLLRDAAEPEAAFHSREQADPALRPQLLLVHREGRRRYVEPAADATLDCSTFRGQGEQPLLYLRRGFPLALRFELPPGWTAAELARAELVLVLADTPARRTPIALAVHALAPPFDEAPAVRGGGVAQSYPRDAGIERDPDVLFADAFEAGTPDARWLRGEATPARIEMPGDDAAPLAGRALRVVIPKGQQLGLDWRYRFRRQEQAEPEEIYFRYHLRLAPSWLRGSSSGKLPGIAGTYNRAGWGGRPWDGKAGWSMRGNWSHTFASGHPAAGQVLLGSYGYHSGSTTYGETMQWVDGGFAGLVDIGRWVAIEQRIKLNTPGASDGEFEAWVDGRRAFRRTGMRWRDTPALRIEEVWLNVFHGGTAPAPADMVVHIDQVVIARRYIGPMRP